MMWKVEGVILSYSFLSVSRLGILTAWFAGAPLLSQWQVFSGVLLYVSPVKRMGGEST